MREAISDHVMLLLTATFHTKGHPANLRSQQVLDFHFLPRTTVVPDEDPPNLIPPPVDKSQATQAACADQEV